MAAQSSVLAFTPSLTRMNGHMNKEDRNFDDLAERFQQRIGNTLKGKVRRAIVHRDLAEQIPRYLDGGWPVLDAGGGYGQMAIDAAQRGHEVTYCDLSAVMTAHARQQAMDAQVLDRIAFFTGPVQQRAFPQPFQLVFFHAVLEWLAQPRDTLLQVLPKVAPGGYLSLMFYNRWSLEFNLLRQGDFAPIVAGNLALNAFKLTPGAPLAPTDVIGWLEAELFRVVTCSGVRVFSDYMAKDRRLRADEDQVLQLELEHSRREPFWRMGRYIHLLCQAPPR